MNIDIISSYQLQNYEKILQEINSEFEKSEQLKKNIQLAEDAITGLKLNLFPCQQKIGHVNVKIFSKVTDILNLYECDLNYCDLQTLSKSDNCCYFLVEVILTKCLLTKFVESECKWMLHINICMDSGAYSKVVPLSDKCSILEVIPVLIDGYECVVDTSLFNYFQREWNTIDLHSVQVDISHHFESYKEVVEHSVPEKFLNLTKLYNQKTSLSYVQPSTPLQCQFKCNFDSQSFIATFIQNSYHRLNLELFSEFDNDTKKVIDLQFCINGKKVTILYNKDTHILKLLCGLSEMLLLKKFFLKYCAANCQDFRKRLRKVRSKKGDVEEMDLSEILALYEEVRKLWL